MTLRLDAVERKRLDSALSCCEYAVGAYSVGLERFTELLSEAVTAPEVALPTIAAKWKQLWEHHDATDRKHFEVFTPEVFRVIELGNPGHDTTIELEIKGYPHYWPTAHAAGHELLGILNNCTGWVDPCRSLLNQRELVTSKLAGFPEVNMGWWRSRLSLEHRNAVAWIEQRDATGQPDNGTDNEEKTPRFTDPPEDIRRAALFLRRNQKEPGGKLDLLTQHAGNVAEAQRLSNELKPSRYGAYLLAGTRFLRTTSGQRK